METEPTPPPWVLPALAMLVVSVTWGALEVVDHFLGRAPAVVICVALLSFALGGMVSLRFR